MKLIYFVMALFISILTACTGEKNKSGNQSSIPQSEIDSVKNQLIGKYGSEVGSRVSRGVQQVAALWQKSDGNSEDFKSFCITNFVANEKELEVTFNKLQSNCEIIYGFFNKMDVVLKEPMHLDMGEMHPIDMMFGSYNTSAHLTDDFFQNKIAFYVSLNFPAYTLKEKSDMGPEWNRKQWAYARMGDWFTSRVPAELIQNASQAYTKGDTYISEYNIFMGNLVDDKMDTYFPQEMKLITHWGLRDELKSNYANKRNGLKKQKMIYEVMKNIITQRIPQDMINSGKYQWNPETDKLYDQGKEVVFKSEPNTRYQILLDNFQAAKAMDPYNPQYPTYIERAFDKSMEISQQEVEILFTELISSPQVKEVAALIKKNLGRPLEPFDIWYNGFNNNSSETSEEQMDKILNQKYPNPAAFQKDLPNILVKLGFTREYAQYLTDKIQVDPSRGAGHAWGAQMKGDKARLRTRIGEKGMNYKGYNIAVHEFGHNVEQTIDLYDIDYYMLNGVPNTAFTEAVAFHFQKRDRELLGFKNENKEKMDYLALDNFWMCYEIMGVSLVDMQVWKWLYAHPNCNSEELKNAVISIAVEIWNKYYADVIGIKDQAILAIYSHMIDSPLYLPAYPIGHLIDFQMEKFLESKKSADELVRMLKQGRIIPQLWMKGAVGEKISIQPILQATTEALKTFNK